MNYESIMFLSTYKTQSGMLMSREWGELLYQMDHGINDYTCMMYWPHVRHAHFICAKTYAKWLLFNVKKATFLWNGPDNNITVFLQKKTSFLSWCVMFSSTSVASLYRLELHPLSYIFQHTKASNGEHLTVPVGTMTFVHWAEVCCDFCIQSFHLAEMYK